MSETLTWQAILFIAVVAVQGTAIAAWLIAKAIKAWKEILK